MPMRPIKLLSLVSILLCLFSVQFCFASESKILSQQLVPVASSIVRIVVKRPNGLDSIATGFVWNDTSLVVTAFHAVLGSPPSKIEVYFTQRLGQGFSTATLEKASPADDLAILRLDNPLPDVSPLTLTDSSSGELTVVGYPFGSLELQSTELRERKIYSSSLAGLVGDNFDGLKQLGFPDLEKEMIAVEGGLFPGNSGAPVFNLEGKVVGVGSGGLQGGTVGLGWIVPSSRIAEISQTSWPHKFEDISNVFFDHSVSLPDHVLNTQKARASVFSAFELTSKPFSTFGLRTKALYLEALQQKDLQSLSSNFEETANIGIYEVSQAAPLAFDAKDKSPKNDEYVSLAALKTVRFIFSCYSSDRLDYRIRHYQESLEPDFSFYVFSDFDRNNTATTSLRLFVGSDPAHLELNIKNEDIRESIVARADHLNVASLFGGGCIVDTSMSLPDGSLYTEDELNTSLLRSNFVVDIETGKGAKIRLEPAALAAVGKLSDRKYVSISRFPEYKGAN